MRFGDAGYPEGSHLYTDDPTSPFFDSKKADAIDDIAYAIELELELAGLVRDSEWIREEAERRYRMADN